MDIPPQVLTWLFSWLLLMPRAIGLFVLLSFASRTILPGMARNALMVSITIVLIPIMIDQQVMVPTDWSDLLLLILKEVFIGLILGFIFSTPFWIMDSVGAIIDRQRGSMSGSIKSPLLESESTILGNFLSIYTVALLFASGGFHYLLKTFFESYIKWPIMTFYPDVRIEISFYFLSLLDSLMYSVVLIAGPVLIVIFLVDLGFGFLNRSVPQINVFILSLPVKGLASILILTLYITKISEYLRILFSEYGLSFQGLEDIL